MRYTQPDALSALLFHDPALGGRPIRLLRARWLLEYFDADETKRLLPRQQLEREHPEAFADDAMLERLLNDLGRERARKAQFDTRSGMHFPGLVSFSEGVSFEDLSKLAPLEQWAAVRSSAA